MSTDDFNICTIYGPNIYVKSIKFDSQILQRRSQELPFGCTKVRRVVWGPPQAPIGSKAGSGRGKGGFRSGVLPVKYLKVNLLIFFFFFKWRVQVHPVGPSPGYGYALHAIWITPQHILQALLCDFCLLFLSHFFFLYMIFSKFYIWWVMFFMIIS